MPRSVLALLFFISFARAAPADNYLVIPFFNASRTPNLAWIGESVSESIAEALASHGLVVHGREEREEAYRRLGLREDANLTRATVIKVGQALGAGQVIYGDFEMESAGANAKSKGSLKITAHVLDLKSMRQGPEFSEISALEDLSAQQTRLAYATLKYLSPATPTSEEEFRRAHPPVRVEALEAYIRGLLAPQAEQKKRWLTQAVRLEPKFAEPSFELGMLAYEAEDFRAAADLLAAVPVTARQYRRAQFYLGICRFDTGNYAAAQACFERVAQAVPINEVWNNLGAAQLRLNLPQAMENLLKALDGDPSDPLYHFNVGYALWKEQHFATVAERFRAVLARQPDDAVAAEFLAKCQRGEGPGATASARQERLKTQFEESAYQQLKAVLDPGKK